MTNNKKDNYFDIYLKTSLFTLPEMFMLKEAFHSCQLSGIDEDKTFEQFMLEEIERRQTANKWKKTHGEIADSLDGENEYLGDYFIHEIGNVCTCFHNSNPNIAIGHKSHPFLYRRGNEVYISAFDDEQWEQCNKVKCVR